MTDTTADNAVPTQNDDSAKDEVIGITPSSYWLLPRKSNFWLARILFLRSLAFIYFAAFLVAYNQNEALIGPNGLSPVNALMTRVNVSMPKNATITDKIFAVPTVLWFTNFSSPTSILTSLDLMAGLGLIISACILLTGSANMVFMFILWILYHSVINAGQRWYSFGWESQLLETGFLAIFLCPFLDLSQVPSYLPTPEIAVLGFRWLLFRIMFGSGLIKVRGDPCWLDFTCMNYFYETQPIPNPLSTFFHQTPPRWHMFEVGVNHFVELVAPFLVLALPFRRIVIFGGIIQIIFQIVFISCGNLSFPNWLTIPPIMLCFDDRFLCSFFPKSTLREVRTAEIEHCYGRNLYSFPKKFISLFYSAMHWSVFALIAYLSIPVVQNLLSQQQLMNTSFDTFRIVNTYGNFGSVTKHRTEVIFEGTNFANPSDPNATWFEYEFPCKPGNVTRRPCFVSPYHYRLDWLMWFAAFEPYQYNPWLIHLAGKMLDNDVKILSQLFALNPFEKKEKPRWVRARRYSYSFAKIRSREWRKKKQWWIRKDDIDQFYLPPVNRTMISPIYQQFGWKNEQQSSFRSE